MAGGGSRNNNNGIIVSWLFGQTVALDTIVNKSIKAGKMNGSVLSIWRSTTTASACFLSCLSRFNSFSSSSMWLSEKEDQRSR